MSHDYRIWIMVAELGDPDRAEENMERFSEAFEERHPDAGAVVAASYHLSALDATFSIEAKDAKDAADKGADVFCDVANSTGLPPTEILEIRATLVHDNEAHREITGELALAP